MKILIVDDNLAASERIRGILSAATDMKFLETTDPKMVHQLVGFGIEFDVALVDLRFVGAANQSHFDGFAVCQRLRNAFPNAVIVGYSSSFSYDSPENAELKKKFLSMGANMVCALDHLTLTPVSELRYEFQALRKKIDGAESSATPKIFIGSSSEGIAVARHIQAALADEFRPQVWDQTAFGLGQVTIESLEKAIREFEFSIFVFTPDDERTSRGATTRVPRDNVVFEAGLFIGSLGRSRSFVVRPKGNGIALPSDLSGVTLALYDPSESNLAAALGPTCLKIRESIRDVRSDTMS